MTFGLLLGIGASLFAVTRYQSAAIEKRFPARGAFAEVAGVRLHYIDHPEGPGSDLPPMVFIHGASGNLNDLESPIAGLLKGRGRMIFLDRPGHGWSSRRDGDPAFATPSGQAGVISSLMERLGIEKAVIVGHSLGASVAAALAVEHPQKTAGLVFIAPATHPWPGAGISWYYNLTRVPLAGWLFSETIAVPGGNLRYRKSVRGVFHPSRMPADYEERSATRLVLRPRVFRNNAADVAGLHGEVQRLAPRYREIRVPTAILSDPADTVVLHDIHSVGLERDIRDSRLVILEGAGHMPAWTRPDAVAAEIVNVGKTVAER